MTVERQFLPLAEAQKPYYVGIDLGGTNIKTGIVDSLGRPLTWLSIPTDTPNGPESAAKRMGESVHAAIKQLGVTESDIGGVGLGSPGTHDIPTGVLIKPNNFRGWENFPIRDRVAAHCGFPVVFQNDANAAAYGEFWVGSGAKYDSMVLFTLGTGVGGGIIIRDMIVSGHNSHGGELGHVQIISDPHARVCSCLQRGHLEGYASATALIARARDEIATGRETSIATRVSQGEALTPLLISQEAERGDPVANELVSDTAIYLGIGIVAILHTIDPEAIVIGGAMTFGRLETKTGRAFLARVKQEIDLRAFPTISKNLQLHYASLGGDAGYIGAAGIARQASKGITV
ncbi:MAG TPA: ROK family protein [Pirellulales bacterium]